MSDDLPEPPIAQTARELLPSGMPLHHVAVGAVNVERSAAFYRELFDLPELGRHCDEAGDLRSIWLDMRGIILMIERVAQPPPLVRDIASGAFLLAFSINEEQRRQKERQVCQLGGSIEQSTEFSSYFRDPEGNRLALSHYPVALPRDIQS